MKRQAPASGMFLNKWKIYIFPKICSAKKILSRLRNRLHLFRDWLNWFFWSIFLNEKIRKYIQIVWLIRKIFNLDIFD